MKFATYAITKNEEIFVDRMMRSVIDDSDEIVIVDTGSTDRTVELIQNWVDAYPDKVKLFHMTIRPWRFDVARNVSLAHVSADIDVCLCLDLDEVMVKGWRQEIEKVWTPGETTRCGYEYVWSWKADGTPDISYTQDKLHSRFGYDWCHPVHETLRSYFIDEYRVISRAVMHHFPDHSKSRQQYLPLLELSVRESPYDPRNNYYLGREYVFNGRWEDAIRQFETFRALPTAVWRPERGSSWRLSGRCWSHLGNADMAVASFAEATKECPEMRESWIEYAECLHVLQRWQACYDACQQALAITEVPDLYITELQAYTGPKVHDLASIASWNLKKYEESLAHSQIAHERDPNDPRLAANLELIRKALGLI